MLVAVGSHGQIRGAALAYRGQAGTVKLQALAVDPDLRRQRIGTRLVRELEQRAQQTGCTSVYLGAEEPARPFYTALGYTGRRSVLSKSLTGAALATSAEARRERLACLKAARNQRLMNQPHSDVDRS
jgi:ribosomal protein S18 acetylase RimI-like enzyme